jgi:predicted phage terminase large subunit-like protein
MRRLVTSDWYQERWHVQLTGDQNEKKYYENASTGFRQACAVGSMTGRRGDRVAWDDPHSVEASLSAAHRETALRVFQETLPTRLNNPDSSAIIVVMQRLHEGDVSGLILSNDFGYEHLCLPMEYEVDRKCRTSIGWEDPRTVEGELLFPERFSRETVERDKKVMGSMATAGQFQQRPAPRSGGFFEWEKIVIVDALPNIVRWVRYWDKAGTDGGGAYTAGVKMGVGDDGFFYIVHVERGQWAAPKRERTIKATAASDGVLVPIWIEQEPGSGGKESAEATIANLIGYTIKAEKPSGDKELRAEPLAVAVEAGMVRMLRGEWNTAYMDEVKLFPASKYKDQVDGSSGAFNRLAIEEPVGMLVRKRN